MAKCRICYTNEAPAGSKSCTLCVAKMVNHAAGDYDDVDDPAVKAFRKELHREKQGPQGGGCAVLVLAAASIPAILAAAGIGLTKLLG